MKRKQLENKHTTRRTSLSLNRHDVTVEPAVIMLMMMMVMMMMMISDDLMMI
jgi:hypothetical protein